MSLSLDQVAQEALRLPATSRAELAERLVESLSNADMDEIQSAWAAEALRQRDEIASGKVPLSIVNKSFLMSAGRSAADAIQISPRGGRRVS